MKLRNSLIWVSVVVASLLAGCQEMATQNAGQPKPTPTVAKKPTIVKSSAMGPEFKISWAESCSVQQANTASLQALKDLRLDTNINRMRSVVTRDPKTGKRSTRKVPTTIEPQMDSLSGVVETRSASGIEFRVEMLLQSSDPEVTQISIVANSTNHSTNELRDQCEILQQRISEGIQNPKLRAVGKSIPYPDTVVLECEVNDLYNLLHEWAEDMRFDCQEMQGDTFYKGFTFSTGSGIDFKLIMRNIETNKTKLEITIENYEDKEEFPMILKSFHDTLQSIKTK